MGMLYTIIVLFTLAALVGLYLITFVLRKKETPKAIAMVHGLLAVIAFVLLIVHTISSGADLVQAIVIFGLAALGGFILFTRDIKGRSLPKSLAIVHGLLAITGFVFLLVYALNK